MKLILAQGNPGTEFEKSRHNVGFLALDFYAARHSLKFKQKSKFTSDIAEMTVGDEKILLVKPTTFYNATGEAALAIANFYKIEPIDILVIHDELALPFGTLRTREKGSDAGNNGIKSLNDHIGENYYRIRVGTANEILEKQGSHDFVLSKFNAKESAKLYNDIIPKIDELIDDFINNRQTTSSHNL